MTSAAAPDMSIDGGERPAWAATPITDASQVEELSDRQLELLFKNGTADVPGFKEKNVYQFCKGHTIINAWTQPVGGDLNPVTGLRDGYPSGTWPNGEDNPVNNAYGKQWFGKIMVTNDSDYTTVWNLLYSNHTIELNTQAFTANPGLDPDGKPSMIINYNMTEDVWARIFLDEIRQVGPKIWIGKVYVQNIVESLLVHPRNAMEDAALKLITVYTNNTQQQILNTLGLEGPNSSPYLKTGIPFPLLWFVLTCEAGKVPALHYTPGARLQSAMAAVLRYNSMGTDLPYMDHTYADAGAVDQPTALGDGDGLWPETRLYGQKLSDLGAIGTIPTLPPQPYEATILEDPRNVLEGKRTSNLTGHAAAPVSQTATQKAIERLADDAYHARVDGGKLVTTAVTTPIQATTDALGITQALAATVAKVLNNQTENVANAIGITDFNKAVQAVATPQIQAAAQEAQNAQHWGEQFNIQFQNNTRMVLGAAQNVVSPVINLTQTLASPVLGLANQAGQAAVAAVGSGIEIAGPAIVSVEHATRPAREAAATMTHNVLQGLG